MKSARKTEKGQLSLTGAVIIVFLSLFLAIVIYMLAIGTNNTFDSEVDESINYRIEEVEANSLLTTTLQDRMYHLPDDFSSEYGSDSDSSSNYKDIYQERTPYKVISYYFSTPQGQNIWIDSQQIPKNQVRDDIKEYFKARFEPLSDSQEEDYYIRIYNPNGQESEYINLRSSQDYSPTSDHLRITSSIALTGGEKAIFTVWSKSATGVTSVN